MNSGTGTYGGRIINAPNAIIRVDGRGSHRKGGGFQRRGNPSRLAPFLNSFGLLGEERVMRMSDGELYSEYCKYANYSARAFLDAGGQFLLGIAQLVYVAFAAVCYAIGAACGAIAGIARWVHDRRSR